MAMCSHPVSVSLRPDKSVDLIFRDRYSCGHLPNQLISLCLLGRQGSRRMLTQHLTRGRPTNNDSRMMVNLEPCRRNLAPVVSLRKLQRLFPLPLARTGAFSPCRVTLTTSCCCCTTDGCRSEETRAVRQGAEGHGVEAQVAVSFFLDQRPDWQTWGFCPGIAVESRDGLAAQIRVS
jgi:hypothetical protein